MVLVRDAYDLTREIAGALSDLGMPDKVARGARVFLKPNLTYPRHKPGVTTSPRFMAAVLEVFHDLGAKVTVGDGDGGYGAWSADLAFEGHGLPALCRRYGAELLNLSTAPTRAVEAEVNGAIYRTELTASLLDETDLFVSLPVPKVHAMTVYSGAIKNQWGCIPDRMRLRRHPQFLGLVWAVNQLLRPRLVLGDAIYVLDRSGPLVGDPVHLNRFIASEDILAFDTVVAGTLMGLDVSQIEHLTIGRYLQGHSPSPEVDDTSTGLRHHFVLRRSLRHRLTVAAFPRQWAVNLLWFSVFGDLAHRILYGVLGNPIAEERAAVEASRASVATNPNNPNASP